MQQSDSNVAVRIIPDVAFLDDVGGVALIAHAATLRYATLHYTLSNAQRSSRLQTSRLPQDGVSCMCKYSNHF